MSQSSLRTHGIYIAGRLIPAAISFLAIGFYTHLVSAEEYGFYALTLLVAMTANLGLFQWLRVSVLRMAPGETVDRAVLRATTLAGFLALLLASAFLAGFAAPWLDPATRSLLGYALPLTWALAWSDLNLDWLRAQLAPWRYSALYFLRALLTAGLGIGLAACGYGGDGLLWGALVGAALPGLLFLRTCYAGANLKQTDITLLRRMLRYGLPLAGTFLIGSLLAGLDRFLLGALAGTAAVGLYAAAYDIARNSLYVLMQSINLGAFPLAIRALEREGEAAARYQLQHNALLLAALSFPAAAGLVAIAPALVTLFLAESYQDTALLVFAPITLATLLNGWRTFYLDQSFQLGKQTGPQLRMMLGALVLSLGLNLLLVPRFGTMGAALANVGTFAALALASLIWGRRIFPLPLPGHDLARILLATVIMLLVLWPLHNATGLSGLVLQTGVGWLAYVGACVWLNVLGVRSGLRAGRRVFVSDPASPVRQTADTSPDGNPD